MLIPPSPFPLLPRERKRRMSGYSSVVFLQKRNFDFVSTAIDRYRAVPTRWYCNNVTGAPRIGVSATWSSVME